MSGQPGAPSPHDQPVECQKRRDEQLKPNPPDQVDEIFLVVQSALVGEYSLERELGRGGMGIVYLAREVRLDRLVAVKVLPPHLAANEDLRLRFHRKSQTVARLGCRTRTSFRYFGSARRAGSRDGVSGGGNAGPVRTIEGPAAAARGRADSARGGVGARVCPRARHRPPRRKTGQHPAGVA